MNKKLKLGKLAAVVTFRPRCFLPREHLPLTRKKPTLSDADFQKRQNCISSSVRVVTGC